VSWPNPQEVQLTRNEEWWGGAKSVAYKNVVFRAMSEQPQVNNVLITGEVDMAFNLSKLDIGNLDRNGLVITTKPGVTIWYGVFNMNSDLVGQKKTANLIYLASTLKATPLILEGQFSIR